MFFRNKVEKVIDLNSSEKRLRDKEDPGLEKGDLPAMLLAAAITIGPIVITLIGLMFLLAWLFGAFR